MKRCIRTKNTKNSGLAQKEQYLTRSGLAQSISSDSLKEKIFTILTNANGEKEYAFIMTDISKFHLINDYWGYETGTKILNFVLRRMELFSAPLFVNRYHSDVFVAVLDITGRKSSDVKKAD
ncbi:GGDEF domain-containing protein [Blautia wexlerae]|nr:GGDEF domain-containing protein [Blautia wexlerae]